MKTAAFTILELLVSMAVLAIILVMLVQVVNGLLQSTRTQSQQMDSVASARRAIDVMAADLQNAVVGESSAILAPTSAGSNLLALLTSRRGSNGSASHRFLAVSYSTSADSQLIRSYKSVDFAQTNLLAAATNTVAPFEPLARGILAVQVRAITETTNFPVTAAAAANWATNTYNGIPAPTGFQAIITRSPAFAYSLTNRTRALEIWVAAVDDQNRQLLPSSYRPANADPTTWRSEIDSSAIPAQAKSGIRVLNKTIPLP